MNAPTWRLWLVGILMVGWALLTIRFFTTQQWLMAALCLILSIANGFNLWRLKTTPPEQQPSELEQKPPQKE